MAAVSAKLRIFAGLESEFFERHSRQLFEARHETFEMVRLHVSLKVFTRFPSFANHQMIVDGLGGKNVVGYAAFVAERQLDEFNGSVDQRFAIFLFFEQ